ncbi:MAG: germination protein Ger(x)C family [Paenibacillaceae bacterium]|nr:germination protein Ger(x)C family [Paenibacillaceae bacterium]
MIFLQKGLLALSILFITSSCTELSERTLIAGVGIDQKEDGTIRLTLALLGSQKQPGSQKLQGANQTTMYTVEGQTIFDAGRKFIQNIGNQLLWPYVKIVVIGPSISHKDVIPMLDFLNRNNEIQPNPYILLSQVSAEEIINLKTDLPILSTVMIEQQIKNQGLLSRAPRVQLYQFNEMMFSHGGTGFASLIKKVTHNKQPVPMVEGMAVLKKGKWVGELDSEKTRGVLWVRGDVEGGILVVQADSEGGDQQVKISLEIMECTKAKIKPLLQEDELSVTLDIHSRMAVGEVLGHFTMNKANVDLINDLAAKEINKEIMAAMKVAQKEWQTDIFGIKQVVERKYPEYWKKHKEEWESIFAELPIQADVEVSIRKLGLVESFP